MHLSSLLSSLLLLTGPQVFTIALRASALEIREQSTFPFDPGFPIRKVIATAVNISSHSWEFGTATEALLELYNPELSVFGDSPFEAAQSLPLYSPLPRGLVYAAEKIVIGTGANALSDGDGAVGDPASLGVGAVLLGKLEGDEKFGVAATETVEADFVYMAPPFLAYYAVDTANITLLREAVFQCQAYRDILHYNTSSPHAAFTGLWEHILGPVNNDPGLWSTGNAWAAAGMTRVLATVIKAPEFPCIDDSEAKENSRWRHKAIKKLTSLIKEIIDGAIIYAGPAAYEDGLIRNYYDNPAIFGETSGSSLLAATVYRMIVLRPEVFGDDIYLDWAEGIRTTLGGTFIYANDTTLEHVDRHNGTVRPAVNPLGWGDVNPWMTGSPEGQSFVTLLYAAWRDCIFAGQC